MTYADFAVIGLIALAALVGLSLGLVRFVLTVSAWIAAAAAAWHGWPQLQPYVSQYVSIPEIASAAAFGAIFLVTLIVATIIAHIISSRVRNSAVRAVDRSLGGVFGACLGAVMVFAAFLFVDSLMPPDDRPVWLTNAWSLPYVTDGARLLKQVLPVEIGSAIEGTEPADTGSTPENTTGGGETGYDDADRQGLDGAVEQVGDPP